MRRLAPLLLALAVGCAGAPDERAVLGDAYLIDDVTFEGVTRFSKGQILDHLHSGETSWVPFTPDYVFNEAMLAVDARRIEALYRAHGFHHARVLDARVAFDHDDEEVDLTFVVEEGDVTRLRALRFEWAPGATLDPNARRALEAESTLVVGEPFEVPRLNDTVGALRLLLRSWGYPQARVRARAEVNEGARVAEVTLALDPGPHATIRAVHVEGLRDVPADRVQVEARFALGAESSPGAEQAVVQALKAMDVFRWVAVQPPEAVEDGEVDLEIRVSEAEPQTVKVGVELGFETTRWEERVVTRYTHTNLFGILLRLDLDVIAGWAELPNPFDPLAHGPVAAFAPTFTKKGWVEDFLVWTWAPAYEVGIEQGYQFHAPRSRVGVSRWFGQVARVDLSHTLRFADFFNLRDDLDRNTSFLGRDFRDPYLLSFARVELDLFAADDVLEPTNGSVLELAYDLAGGPFQGDFDYQKATATLRGYWKPAGWLQFAARAHTGVILPYGDRPGAPLDRKFYLGGADTVRGFGSKRLSPRLTDCADGTDDCEDIPIGGFTVVQGNLEARFALGAGFGFVAFADAGDVQADELTWVVDEWNYTAGPGLRYDSPVGLFRLDLGIRLNDPGVYPDEPSWAIYFGLGEAF